MGLLILLIVVGAILAVFSQDVINLLKKWFKIPGMALFLPLFFFSAVVIWSESYLGIALDAVRKAFFLPASWVGTYTGRYGYLAISVLFMTGLAVIPVRVFDAWLKRTRYVGLSRLTWWELMLFTTGLLFYWVSGLTG